MKRVLLFSGFVLLLLNANAQNNNDTVANKSSVDSTSVISDTDVIIIESNCFPSFNANKFTYREKFSTDITKAMLGEFAGVQVITTNGQPGVASDIRIRGTNSVTGYIAPLYVVDGMPFYGDITSINPADIVSITVDKDINSLVLYGTQASNGVINITTKKGNAGIPRIDIGVSFGLNLAPQRYETVNDPKTYTELGWLGLYTAAVAIGQSPETAAYFANNNLFSPGGASPYYNPFDRTGKTLINQTTGKMFDDVGYRYVPEKWSDYLLRTGKKYETNASISGGTNKLNYYTSFGFIKDEGYYQKSDFQRINALANLGYNPFKWLDIKLKVAYNNSVLNDPCQGDNNNSGFIFLNGMPPIYPVYYHDANGKTVIDPRTGKPKYDFGVESGQNRPFGYGINPVALLQLDKSISNKHNFLIDNWWEVKFYKDLKFVATIGFNYQAGTQTKLQNPFYGDAEGIGRISKLLDTNIDFESQQMLQYQKTIADVHNLDAFVAHYLSFNNYSYVFGEGSYLYNPYSLDFSNAALIDDLEGATNKSARENVSAQVRYNYDEKYFLNANISYDKSSIFAPKNRWFLSWAVGSAWNIGRENFMKPSRHWLSELKLNFSYGVIGNENFYYGYTFFALPDAKRERGNVYNAGISANIKRHTLDIEVDFYDRTTQNLFFPIRWGFSFIPTYDGSMNNRGFELALRGIAVNTRNIGLSWRLNLAHNVSKMLKMPTEFRWGEWREIISYQKGRAWDTWYLHQYAGVSKDGQSMWIGYYDKNNKYYPDGTIMYINDPYYYLNMDVASGGKEHPNAVLVADTVTNYQNAGYSFVGKKVSPDVFGGFGFDFDCYGFNISATFAYQIGGYGYDIVYANLMGDNQFGAYGWHKDMLKAWNPMKENNNTDVPRLTGGLLSDAWYANSGSSRFLTSNSALQLANLTFGYNFPQKIIRKIFINRLNISAACNNLLLASKRKGYNPFTILDDTSIFGQYAQGVTLNVGLKVEF